MRERRAWRAVARPCLKDLSLITSLGEGHPWRHHDDDTADRIDRARSLTHGRRSREEHRVLRGAGLRLSFSTTTENVRATAERVKAAGFRLISEPQANEWATSTFDATDPSGFLVSVYADKDKK